MSATEGTKQNQVLFVAFHSDFEPMARLWLKDFTDLQFVAAPALEALFDTPPAGVHPKLILLDGRGEPQKILEWTQGLKMAYPVPLVVFYDSKTQLEFSILKKNGADGILHLYYDAEFIIDKLLDLVQWDESGAPPLALLNALAAEDLTTEMDLNFDVYVYLPGNQKSVLVRKKGTAIDQKIIDRAKAAQQNVYFKKSELKHFLEYSRTALSLKNSDEGFGVTDKVLRARQHIQEIISQFFDLQSKDYKGGKLILENCEKIIDELEIKKWTSDQAAVRNMILFSGRTQTFYNDVMTLSMLSAGIAYLLEKKPEEILELSLAALLHNVGIAFLTKPQLEPDLTKLDETSRKEYLNYPEKSVVQIKAKKVPLPQAVTELIQEHREKCSGGGFPKGLGSSEHHPRSRIIQMAYTLMQLTQMENNKAKYTLKSALEHLQQEMMKGNNIVDGTILLTVKKKVDAAV